MAIYALFVFNRHCECIYHTSWRRGTVGNSTGGGSAAASAAATAGQNSLDAEATGDPDLAAAVAEDAKLVYGVVFSLRNMVSKLAPRKDAEGFQSYRAGAYRLHFFETPSGMRLVMTTDPASEGMRAVLQRIYADVYVEYVVKNPLAKHGAMIRNELFRTHLNALVRSLPNFP